MEGDWQSRGACVGAPPGIFYAERGEPSRADEARDICAACPVQTECYEYAVHHEKHGIWAGTTPRQREAIRGRRGILLRTPGTYVEDNGSFVDDGTLPATVVADLLGVHVNTVRDRRSRRDVA